MAKTASLYRCMVKNIPRPAELLALLNDEICETATRGMFVTMAAGVYDPSSGATQIANAGHEPPVCHAEGRSSIVEAGAPPLGIVPGVEIPETELDLRGGSLYIFSDGLTEAETKSGNQLGREGFEALVQKFADLPLAGRVEVSPMTENRAKQVLQLRFSARATELKKIREAVRGAVTECGGSAKSTADIVLAIDEACQNIIRHAYRGDSDNVIELEVEHRGEHLVFSLTDHAPAIDPSRVKPRDLEDVRPGGLGTHFIRRVMDEVEFERPASGRGNLLRMVRRID
jgi:sigma-B regulation protein RsbU (phosphoserine phosphatase)